MKKATLLAILLPLASTASFAQDNAKTGSSRQPEDRIIVGLPISYHQRRGD
jgi:hypothetical protein